MLFKIPRRALQLSANPFLSRFEMAPQRALGRARVSGVSLSRAPIEGGFNSLRVNGSRLMESIHSTCEYGKAHRYGE